MRVCRWRCMVPEAWPICRSCLSGGRRSYEPFIVLRCSLPAESRHLQSLAPQIPLLGWYEREIQDLCGIHFYGHPEPRPLVLHEGAHPPMPPLDPRYQPAEMMPFTSEPWSLPPIEGDDVQTLPFGPVRGDVLESAQIFFYYIGEAILHCHPRLFFKHRGMEKRFEGLSPSWDGFGRTNFRCRQHLALVGVLPGNRDSLWMRDSRTCHVSAHNSGGIGTALQPSVLFWPSLPHNHVESREAQGKLLAEQCKQINGTLTGSRFLRGILMPGGLRRDLDVSALPAKLNGACTRRSRLTSGRMEETNSHLDRLITTGHLPQQTPTTRAQPGRSSELPGLPAIFAVTIPTPPTTDCRSKSRYDSEGDAHARVQVRMEEILRASSLIVCAVETIFRRAGNFRNQLSTRAQRVWDGAKAPRDPRITVCISTAQANWRESRSNRRHFQTGVFFHLRYMTPT